MSTTAPIVVPGEVVRVFSYNRVQLRLAVWPAVEVQVEARLEGLDSTPTAHDNARQCAIILMGGKKVIAHVDRRASNPITRLYRTVRHPIDGHMADGVAEGYGPLLFINSFLQSLAPDFSAERATKALNR